MIPRLSGARYAVSVIGKITIYFIFIVALVSLFLFLGRVSYEVVPTNFLNEKKRAPIVGISADVWGVFDTRTGEVYLGEKVNEVRPIASISKLFTAYVAIKSEKIDNEVVISWSDLNTEGRAGKLAYGDRLTVRELLFSLLIESSNDAGEAIRRTLGTDFEHQIEVLKKELHLSSTTISDGSGLSAQNLSTVTDLALFYTRLYQNHQHILDITKLKVYIGEDNGWINNDPASEHENFLGGKNGFTYEAGRTFAGAFRVSGTNRDVGLILLGSTDIVRDVALFTEYIERAY